MGLPRAGAAGVRVLWFTPCWVAAGRAVGARCCQAGRWSVVQCLAPPAPPAQACWRRRPTQRCSKGGCGWQVIRPPMAGVRHLDRLLSRVLAKTSAYSPNGTLSRCRPWVASAISWLGRCPFKAGKLARSPLAFLAGFTSLRLPPARPPGGAGAQPMVFTNRCTKLRLPGQDDVRGQLRTG